MALLMDWCRYQGGGPSRRGHLSMPPFAVAIGVVTGRYV